MSLVPKLAFVRTYNVNFYRIDGRKISGVYFLLNKLKDNMYFKIIVVVVVSTIMTQGISAGYPGFIGYQQPSQGFFPPAPAFYQPRPALRYDIGLAQPPPQHYYSPPENTYRGFSYETRYQDGASSHVVYVTGPQSQELMHRSFAAFRNVVPVAPPRPVIPTLPSIVVPATNSTPTPTTANFNSAPRVFSLPRQFTPVFNMPSFIPPPFPYRSFASPFFNPIPPQLQGNYLASDPSQANIEPASEVQESMIREVAVPEIISNRIGDSQDPETTSATSVETSSASTAGTQASVEATSSEEPIIVTEAQTEASSAAPADPSAESSESPTASAAESSDSPTVSAAEASDSTAADSSDSPAASAESSDSPAASETATSAEEAQATEVTTSASSNQEDSAPAADSAPQSETATEGQVSETQTEATSEETTTEA